MQRWHSDGVVLFGEGRRLLPNPNSGLRTTDSLIGCYVLAGELARYSDDVDAALRRYENALRPFVVETQKLGLGMPRLFYCDMRAGIWLMHRVICALISVRIDGLLHKILSEEYACWKIPDYTWACESSVDESFHPQPVDPEDMKFLTERRTDFTTRKWARLFPVCRCTSTVLRADIIGICWEAGLDTIPSSCSLFSFCFIHNPLLD